MLDVTEYKNAVVLPTVKLDGHNFLGGIYCDGHFVNESHVYTQAPYVKPSQIIHETAIWGGIIFNHFGHFILESLARIGCALKHPNISVYWTTADEKPPFIKQWMKEIFEILNVKNNHIIIQEPTQFDSIIVQFPGYIHGKNYFSAIQEKTLSQYPSKATIKGKKLYLSRTKLSKDMGGFDNEDEIETILKENDWTIFHPQEHSVYKQLDELSSAEIIFGIESSAFYSLLLINRVNANINTIPKAESCVKDFHIIAKVRNYNYTTFSINKQITRHAPYQPLCRYNADISEIQKILMKTNNFTIQSNKTHTIITNTAQPVSIETAKNNILSARQCSFWQNHFYLAKLYANNKKFIMAKQELDLAMTVQNLPGCIFAEYCKVLIALGDTEFISAWAQKAVDKQSHWSFFFRMRLAEECRKQKNWTAAEALVQDIIAAHPDRGAPHRLLSYILDAQSKRNEAVIPALRAVEIEPTNLALRTHAANLLRWTKQNDNAIQLMQKALEIDPNWDESYRQFSYIERDKNNLDEAVLLARKSIEVNPNKVNSNNHLCNILRMRSKSDQDEILQICHKTISQHNDQEWAFIQLCNIYLDRGDCKSAYKYIDEALKIEPHNSTYRKLHDQIIKLLSKTAHTTIADG